MRPQSEPSCVVCYRVLKGRKAIHCTLTRCGVICDGQCLTIHLRNCPNCACVEAIEEIPVDCRGAYLDAMPGLPGFENVAADRAAAAVEAEGESLSAQMLTPLPSISRTAGAIQTHSPLFRETAANPQLSLF